jgi:hypothetical protein
MKLIINKLDGVANLTEVKINELDGVANLTDSASSASSASTFYVPKDLSPEQKDLFQKIKCLPEIDPKNMPSSVKFLILGRTKFVIAVSGGKITHQKQIFGVIANTTNAKKNKLEVKKINLVFPNLKDYDWSEKKALFYFE